MYFPWQFNASAQIQSNDLTYYAQVTDPKGPAMTWAMFVVNWLSLNESGKAQTYFDRSFANMQAPFNVWTEIATGGGAVNFITGAGGFLQQFIFGYPDIRMHAGYLSLDFKFLPWPRMSLAGLDYLRNELDVVFERDGLCDNVTVKASSEDAANLELVTSDGQSQPLALGWPVQVTAMPVKVQPM